MYILLAIVNNRIKIKLHTHTHTHTPSLADIFARSFNISSVHFMLYAVHFTKCALLAPAFYESFRSSNMVYGNGLGPRLILQLFS